MGYSHYPWTITGLGPGDHLCSIYETEEEYRSVLAPFVRRGLNMGEKVIYVTHAHTPEGVLGHLEASGLDVMKYVNGGQLQLVPSELVYMLNGRFSPERVIAQMQLEMAKALAEGYSALCMAGEMGWARTNLPGAEKLVHYEQQLNDLFPGTRCLALCLYSRADFEQRMLLSLLRAHPIAIIGDVGYDKYSPLASLPPARVAQPQQAR